MTLVEALAQLNDALEDSDNKVWTAAEKEFILESALSQVNQIRPRSVRDEIVLVQDDDTYVLTNVYTVVRVDLINEDGKLVMVLPHTSWELWGDNETEGQTLWIDTRYFMADYSVRVHGYGPWEWDA